MAAVDASGLAQDPQTLLATGVVTATLRAEGGELPPGPLRVTFYEERDGRPGYGPDDRRLAERRIAGRTVGAPSLGVGATRAVTAGIAATMAFRGAPIGAALSRLSGGRDREPSNDARDTVTACRRPAAAGSLSGSLAPRIVWRWPAPDARQPIVAPLSVRVGHAPMVMDVTGDDVPDVVVQTIAPEIHPSSAHLRALDGRTGEAHWTVTDPALAVYAFTAPALGDVDGDGRPEIVAIGGRADEQRAGDVWRALAFRGDGTLLWESAPQPTGAGDARADPGVTLADVDGDGRPEVLAGGAILDGATGARRLDRVPVRAVVADVDRDGRNELTSGATVVRARPDGPGGSLALSPVASPVVTATKQLIALFDLPGARAEGGLAAAAVAHVGPYGVLSVFRLDGGEAVFDATFPGRVTGAMQRQGGAPVVADVDGDGRAEVGVAGQRAFAVFDPERDSATGAVRLRSDHVAVADDHFGFTGAAAFDLDGDGRWEIVHGDEASLYVLGMPEAAPSRLQVLWSVPKRSATNSEMPVVADVNADGRADIVAPNEPRELGEGITVYSNDAWMTARRVWNQHAYFVDNVADDGTIPPVPAPSWLRHGTFRANPLPRGDGSANAAANLTAGQLVLLADGAGGARPQVRVGNAGAAPAGPGLVVAFFRDDEEAPFATVELTRALGVGAWRDVVSPVALGGAATVTAWVDWPAPRGPRPPTLAEGWPECHEADNVHAQRVGPPVTPTASPTASQAPGTAATPSPPRETPASPTPRGPDEGTPTSGTAVPPRPTASPSPSATRAGGEGGPLYLPRLLRGGEACSDGRAGDIVVVADASASMERLGADGSPLRRTLARALVDLGPSQRAAGNRLGLVAFDAAVRAVVQVADDAGAWGEAVALLERPATRSGSALDVAVAAGADLLAGRGPGRRALVVATDAFRVDRSVARRAVDAAEAARRDGIPVGAVGLGTTVDGGLLARLAGSAQRVAQANDAAGAARALDDVLRATTCDR